MIVLFRAKVHSVVDVVSGGTKEGRKEIYIVPVAATANVEQPMKAYPPNFIPINDTGSGVWSWPEPGQQCIVAKDTNYLEAFILSYTVFPGSDIFGNYIEAETGQPGSVILKTGDWEDSKIAMYRDGRMDIQAHRFSRISFDGSSRYLEIQSLPMRIDFAGGAMVFNYKKEADIINIPEITSNTLVFKRSYEQPAAADWEQSSAGKEPVIPSQFDYVDKCVIRAGYIPNFDSPYEESKHVFQLDTRQSIGSDTTKKDMITELRIGYQWDSYRADETVVPEGTILEWNSNKNVLGNKGYLNVRYGKTQTGNTAGELFKFSMTEGDNDEEAYELSIGTKSDGTMYRESYVNNDISRFITFGKNTLYSDIKTGKNVTQRELITDNSYLLLHETNDVENSMNFSSEDITISHVANDISDVSLKLDNEEITINRKALDGKESEVIYLTDQEVYIGLSSEDKTDFIDIQSDEIEFENRSGSDILLNGEEITVKSGGHSSENITIDGEEFVLNHGNSQISIKDNEIVLTTANNSITMTDSYIEFNILGAHTLKFSASGLVLNGTSFVMEPLLSWINSNASSFGMGNMAAPVPLFPSALTAFQVSNNTPYSPTMAGFKS